MKWKHLAAILCVPIVFAACSSGTKITSSWQSPENSQLNTGDKVLILGMMPDKDRAMRANIESEIVRQLQAQGYQAVSAYEAFGPADFKSLNEKQLTKKMQGAGFQNVLTVALLDKEKERNYTPGRVDYHPVLGYNPFWRRYVYYYDRVYRPGYYRNVTNYFLEANLYDIRNGQLMYSVQSQTSDPASVVQLSRSFSKTLVSDLGKKKILLAKNT